jgi:transposase InsO family protein
LKDRHRAAARPHTKLRGPAKGIFYQLYVLIDIYSRFNPSWIVSPVEDSLLATDFIAEAIERNGATPHTVHADRGSTRVSPARHAASASRSPGHSRFVLVSRDQRRFGAARRRAVPARRVAR